MIKKNGRLADPSLPLECAPGCNEISVSGLLAPSCDLRGSISFTGSSAFPGRGGGVGEGQRTGGKKGHFPSPFRFPFGGPPAGGRDGGGGGSLLLVCSFTRLFSFRFWFFCFLLRRPRIFIFSCFIYFHVAAAPQSCRPYLVIHPLVSCSASSRSR